MVQQACDSTIRGGGGSLIAVVPHQPGLQIASYLLAALWGNSSPSTKDIKKILDSVGIKADDACLNKVISELNGKNIENVIAQSVRKLASVPAGGAVAVSAAPGSAAQAAGSAPAAGEEKKDEKKKESEESDDDMGFGLFD
ncbi:60S acidic ribosomal protein P2-like [Acomys russatus]|uniref:60S acidic ribosomal protein P2-like n=1 Tax=Acomys russatus TaxID=60746 RepID=UPI0021E2B57A|nr:60S acidic ribosomal protein P2-like [Acomys russatus]